MNPFDTYPGPTGGPFDQHPEPVPDGDSGHADDPDAAHHATAITYGGSAEIPAGTVDSALDLLGAEKADTAHQHDASVVGFTPAGGIAATDVQAALVEVAGDHDAHLGDTDDAHDASAVSFPGDGMYELDPLYGITDVQTALLYLNDALLSIANDLLVLTLGKVDVSGDVMDGDLDFGANSAGVILADRQSVASAAGAITLPAGNYFTITGTAAITSINTPTNGRLVILHFASTASLVDGGNLVLSGNFAATQNDQITLVGTGSVWIEVARSGNN